MEFVGDVGPRTPKSRPGKVSVLTNHPENRSPSPNWQHPAAPPAGTSAPRWSPTAGQRTPLNRSGASRDSLCVTPTHDTPSRASTPVTPGHQTPTAGLRPGLWGLDSRAQPCPASPKAQRAKNNVPVNQALLQKCVLAQTGLKQTPSFQSPGTFRFSSHFTFAGVIGRSKFSEVYKVMHAVTREVFAVKVITRKMVSRTDRERALREVKVVADLPEHPNVVSYFRGWQENRCLHIQMEYCDKGTLAQLLAGCEGQLHESEIWTVARDIAGALSFIHMHGVVHLDLKPENIFMKDGIGGTLYSLGDFGLAIQIGTAGADWEEGDGDYVAPELLASDTRMPTSAADLFSLGATLYECATGSRLPHNTRGQPITLPGRSPALTTLVNELLLVDPVERITAQDVLDGINMLAVALRPLPMPRVDSKGWSGAPGVGGAREEGLGLHACPSESVISDFSDVEGPQAMQECELDDMVGGIMGNSPGARGLGRSPLSRRGSLQTSQAGAMLTCGAAGAMSNVVDGAEAGNAIGLCDLRPALASIPARSQGELYLEGGSGRARRSRAPSQGGRASWHSQLQQLNSKSLAVRASSPCPLDKNGLQRLWAKSPASGMSTPRGHSFTHMMAFHSSAGGVGHPRAGSHSVDDDSLCRQTTRTPHRSQVYPGLALVDEEMPTSQPPCAPNNAGPGLSEAFKPPVPPSPAAMVRCLSLGSAGGDDLKPVERSLSKDYLFAGAPHRQSERPSEDGRIRERSVHGLQFDGVGHELDLGSSQKTDIEATRRHTGAGGISRSLFGVSRNGAFCNPASLPGGECVPQPALPVGPRIAPLPSTLTRVAASQDPAPSLLPRLGSTRRADQPSAGQGRALAAPFAARFTAEDTADEGILNTSGDRDCTLMLPETRIRSERNVSIMGAIPARRPSSDASRGCSVWGEDRAPSLFDFAGPRDRVHPHSRHTAGDGPSQGRSDRLEVAQPERAKSVKEGVGACVRGLKVLSAQSTHEMDEMSGADRKKMGLRRTLHSGDKPKPGPTASASHVRSLSDEDAPPGNAGVFRHVRRTGVDGESPSIWLSP